MEGPYIIFFVLIIAAASAFATAVISWKRRGAPGSVPLTWLLLAISHWCLTSAMHTVTPDLAGKILWAKVQYLAIASVPLLWLLFTLDYARWRVVSGYRLALLWVIPIITIAMAWTNEWHGLLWSNITPASGAAGARLVYHYGAWFWVAVVYNYLLLLNGALVLARALYRHPPPFRRQSVMLLLGAVIPWIGNIAYLTHLIPVPGLDITPLAFTASSLLCAWGIFRYRILDLVPVAHDIVIENMRDAVVVLDRHGGVVSINEAAVRLVGRPAAQLIGKPVQAIAPEWPDVFAASGHLPPASAEMVREQDGEQRHYEMRVSPLNDQRGRLLGQLLVLHDTTAREQAAKVREQLVRQDEALRAKREFLSIVSHELRTPLTPVIGYIDLLLLGSGGVLTDEQRNYLEIIRSNTRQMASLVDDLLEMGRIETNKLTLNYAPTSMTSLIESSITLLGLELERKQMALTCEIAPALPPVEVDAKRIGQVLANLLSNAIKYSYPAGHITIRAHQSDADHVEIQVEDTGIGLSPIEQRQLFTPFYRADSALRSKANGTGLGLSIAKSFVELHGGSIKVRSRVDTGSVFTFTLPIRQQARSAS
jgi:PAS domain S-box-containing protein